MRHAASQALQSTIKRNHVISEKKKPESCGFTLASHAGVFRGARKKRLRGRLVSRGTRGIVSELSVALLK